MTYPQQFAVDFLLDVPAGADCRLREFFGEDAPVAHVAGCLAAVAARMYPFDLNRLDRVATDCGAVDAVPRGASIASALQYEVSRALKTHYS